MRDAKQELVIAFDVLKPMNERIHAARRAAELGRESMVVPLVVLLGQLKKRNEPVAMGALLEVLESVGAVYVLGGELKSSDAAVRVRAAQLLGMLGDTSSGPALIDALGDPEHKVREAVASALRKLKEARALDVLATLVVADPHPDVRGACAQALGELDDPRALEALEFATRRENDVFTVILIERSILRFADRHDGKRQEELSSNAQVRLPSVYGIRLPPARRTSSFICSAT